MSDDGAAETERSTGRIAPPRWGKRWRIAWLAIAALPAGWAAWRIAACAHPVALPVHAATLAAAAPLVYIAFTPRQRPGVRELWCLVLGIGWLLVAGRWGAALPERLMRETVGREAVRIGARDGRAVDDVRRAVLEACAGRSAAIGELRRRVEARSEGFAFALPLLAHLAGVEVDRGVLEPSAEQQESFAEEVGWGDRVREAIRLREAEAVLTARAEEQAARVLAALEGRDEDALAGISLPDDVEPTLAAALADERAALGLQAIERIAAAGATIDRGDFTDLVAPALIGTVLLDADPARRAAAATPFLTWRSPRIDLAALVAAGDADERVRAAALAVLDRRGSAGRYDAFATLLEGRAGGLMHPIMDLGERAYLSSRGPARWRGELEDIRTIGLDRLEADLGIRPPFGPNGAAKLLEPALDARLPLSRLAVLEAAAADARAGPGAIDRAAVPPLLRLLGDSCPLVREAAAACLALCEPPPAEAFAPLRVALADPHAATARSAALALAGHGPRAVDPLAAALAGDDRPPVRQAATNALASVAIDLPADADPRRAAIDHIVAALGDADGLVRLAATGGLLKLAGPATREALTRAAAADDPALRERAAELLAELDARESR